MNSKKQPIRSLSVAIVRRFRLLRVGEYPRKGDQFLYCGDSPGQKRGWKNADANLLAEWRGPVPTWYKGRYRRRVLPNIQQSATPGGQSRNRPAGQAPALRCSALLGVREISRTKIP